MIYPLAKYGYSHYTRTNRSCVSECYSSTTPFYRTPAMLFTSKSTLAPQRKTSRSSITSLIYLIILERSHTVYNVSKIWSALDVNCKIILNSYMFFFCNQHSTQAINQKICFNLDLIPISYYRTLSVSILSVSVYFIKVCVISV